MKSIQEREAAELVYSAHDAASREEDLVIHDIQRYAQPNADTPFFLEYSFHLLGDVTGKTVLDYGCGAGENSTVLSMRGANTIGVDLSPELISIAERRLEKNGQKAHLKVGSCHDL